MRIDIDGQLVNIRKGEELLVLPLSLFPREFVAFVDKPSDGLTEAQRAYQDKVCFECG